MIPAEAMRELEGIFQRAVPTRREAVSIVSDTEAHHDNDVAEASREAIAFGKRVDRDWPKVRAQMEASYQALRVLLEEPPPQDREALKDLCQRANDGGLSLVEIELEGLL